jgi:MYXO-CTERM domain-containing protein
MNVLHPVTPMVSACPVCEALFTTNQKENFMRKKIAAVGLAALLTVGTSASTFAQQQQQPGTATQAPTSQQANQSRNDNDFPWGLLGLLGLAGLAGLKRRDHEVRRDERMPTGTPVGTQSRVS